MYSTKVCGGGGRSRICFFFNVCIYSLLGFFGRKSYQKWNLRDSLSFRLDYWFYLFEGQNNEKGRGGKHRTSSNLTFFWNACFTCFFRTPKKNIYIYIYMSSGALWVLYVIENLRGRSESLVGIFSFFVPKNKYVIFFKGRGGSRFFFNFGLGGTGREKTKSVLFHYFWYIFVMQPCHMCLSFSLGKGEGRSKGVICQPYWRWQASMGITLTLFFLPLKPRRPAYIALFFAFIK